MAIEQLNEEAIFNVARKIEVPDARTSYLQQVCGGDLRLLKRVTALLSAHEEEQDFLEEPAVTVMAISDTPSGTEKLGAQIGPYKLLEQIGEGGMGVVYMAEQQQPMRRKVAFKIIKPGMDTKQVIARFEAERQALALMDHPNIAKVHDAGSTDTGHPYFVMELIRGISITRFCDQNRLTTHKRLELFIQICQAVEHAHHQGIIHRDLKPNNVMVTLYDGVPVPKIIDFGVAKATSQQLTERTLFTTYNQMIGTPLYMSPEQAEMSGLGVDTRTDVYSLGVLLYELLVGTTPFDSETLKNAGFDEMRRIIREDEPGKPSSRISTVKGMATTTVSEQRKTDPRKLSRLIAGDLDWIVMKALEKNRDHRYESVQAFADDVQRFLDNKPIMATRPSFAKRVRKWTQRHRSVTTALLVLAVCGPILGYGAIALLRLQKPAPPAAVDSLPTARAPGRFLPGLVPEPTYVPRIGRWQVITKLPRGIMRSAVFSPDEQRIAFGEAGNVRICDANMQLLHVLVGHSGHVASVSWHPDGKRLASASWDGTVRLWTVDGVPTHVLSGHSGEVYQVAWHPDGERLASVGADGTVRLWNADGSADRVLRDHRNHVFCLAWSPDGQLLVTGGGDIRPPDENGDPGDNAIRLWDVETGKVIAMLQGHQLSVLSLAWHPDGQQLASGDGNVFRSPQPTGTNEKLATVRLWSVDGTSGPVLPDRYASIYAVAWNPDGRQLAFGGRFGIVQVWHPAEGMVTTSLTNHLRDLDTIVWNAAGTGLLTTSRESMCLWRMEDGALDLKLEALPEAGFTEVAWSPDGKQIASVGQLWQADGTPGPKVGGTKGGGVGRAPAWSQNGEWLATEGDANTLQLWHADGTAGQGFPSGHSGGVFGLAWHPDGRRLASASSDGTVRVRNSDGTEEQVFKAQAGPRPSFRSVVWHPDGDLLAAASWVDAAARIWDQKAKLVTVLKGHRGGVESVDWSPDGNWLVSGGGGSVRLWKPDGTPGPVLTGHTSEVYPVAWSPDGRWIASGSTDGTVRLWKPDGSPDRVLRGHHGVVHSLAWSPDSRHVVSGGWLDNTLRVWDVETGKTEWQVLGLDDEQMVTFSRSGQILHGDREAAAGELLYLVENLDGTATILEPNKFHEKYDTTLVAHFSKLAERLAAKGRSVETRVALQQLQTLQSDANTSKIAQAVIKVDRQLVKLAAEQGEWDRAEAAFDDALVFQSYPDVDTRSAVAGVGSELARALRNDKQFDQAERAIRTSIRICEQIVQEVPEDAGHQYMLMVCYSDLGNVLYDSGELPEATAEISKAIEAMNKAIEIAPNDADVLNNVAWFLATCPESEFWNPNRAVELARRAVEMEPNSGHYWNTLGVAQHRKGDWQTAIESLTRSNELLKGDILSFNGFFLAMAHWQMDQKDDAVQWYHKAIEWMEKNKHKDGELRRFRVEAEALLGIPETTKQRAAVEAEELLNTDHENTDSNSTPNLTTVSEAPQ